MGGLRRALLYKRVLCFRRPSFMFTCQVFISIHQLVAQFTTTLRHLQSVCVRVNLSLQVLFSGRMSASLQLPHPPQKIIAPQRMRAQDNVDNQKKTKRRQRRLAAEAVQARPTHGIVPLIVVLVFLVLTALGPSG